MGKVIVSGGGRATVPSSFPAIGTPLNSLAWEEVRAISDAGLAADYFAVGDVKTIVLNGTIVSSTTLSNLSVDVFVLGIDHNASVEGSNRIHFGIGKISGKDIFFHDGKNSSSTGAEIKMTTSAYNNGGWASSHMRKTVLGSDSTPASPTANTLLAALPADLRAVMKTVTKYTDNNGGKSDTASYVTATTEYLPLLAEFEVSGTRYNANSAEQNYQKQYDYYKAGNSKLRYKHDDTRTAYRWFLRSVDSGGSTTWVGINESGNFYNGRVGNQSSGCAPLFCV